MYQKQNTWCPEIVIYGTVKQWNSKEKFPEQKNTDLGILSESTIQISFIREIDILKSHCNNQFINQTIIIEKQIQNWEWR